MRDPPSGLELAFRARAAHGEGMAEPLKSDERLLFASAFREHYPDLVAFVRRRAHSDAEAADIAQEACARVLRYRDEKNLADLRPLVFRIAINVMSTRARIARARRWNQHIPLEEDLSLVAGDPSQDREIAGKQLLDRLMAVIDKLPRKCRHAFLLRRFHGLGREEIAERMGISAKAVDKHIATAVALCRKKVGKDWP